MSNSIDEIVIGDKSRFALTSEVDIENPAEGNIYIYLDNKKFGSSSFTYELDFFLWHAVGEFSNEEFVYPPFFPITAFEMISGIDQLYSDVPNSELCIFERLAPGFIKAFEESDERSFYGTCADDVIESILVRGGNYAFNYLTMVLISNSEKAKLFVGECKTPDQNAKFYKEPFEYCRATELDLGEFFMAFKLLYKAYRDKWPEYAERYEEE